MDNILKPYTIIPPDLYVLRDADRQVKNIIQDMGRPGYVLVSRQMGKTNLLLNAKRILETPNDVFVYVDLSNPFENAKSCFENIIDTAIETNQDKFSQIVNQITDRRSQLTDIPAHKQHTNELRLLLKCITGKLVIILDEIDALTKTQYSDQIFAQIRSVYFSRVNFKEFEKLTYLLSGVIEPTEIIKDPKISPFNIGQKIFLNDFNRDEFNQFLLKSQLNLSEIVKDRIFYWTNGNPRMTWDLCSEVETIINYDKLKIEDIDKLVTNLYLTTYDKPPIDNIRELVKNDRELRHAIIEIGYSKGKEVSDKIKSKLYLSGIINYEESNILIKNKIISQALNIDWIQSLEEEDKGLVRIAIEYSEKGKYQESLDTFDKFLETNEFEEAERSLCYYYMGYAAYRISNFSLANEYLNKALFDVKEEAKWYYRIQNLKGLVFYYLDQIEESLKCIKTVLDSGRKDDIYVRALINYGSISLKSEGKKHTDEAIQIFNTIINNEAFDENKLKVEFINELKSIAHFNLGQINNKANDFVSAKLNYQKALYYSEETAKPKIVLSLLEILDSKEEKLNLLNELFDTIISKEIKPSELDPEKPIGFSTDDFREILILSIINFEDTLFQKIKPYISLFSDNSISKVIYELAIFSINAKKEWDNATRILQHLYLNLNNSEYNFDKITEYNTLKLYAYFTRSRDSLEPHIKYIELVKTERVLPLDFLDLEIFANLILNFIENKKLLQALEYVNLIESLKSEVSADLLINYLVIYHFELNIYLQQGKSNDAVNKARDIIALANNEIIRNQHSSLLGETGLEVIKRNAESILNPPKQLPIRNNQKYGRNTTVTVKYKDGSIVEAKFKRVEEDLLKGLCIIIN